MLICNYHHILIMHLKTIDLDIRMIAATNKDLQAMVMKVYLGRICGFG
jgi:transcriptional regulator of acetoin/glycerol metabolism